MTLGDFELSRVGGKLHPRGLLCTTVCRKWEAADRGGRAAMAWLDGGGSCRWNSANGESRKNGGSDQWVGIGDCLEELGSTGLLRRVVRHGLLEGWLGIGFDRD